MSEQKNTSILFESQELLDSIISYQPGKAKIFHYFKEPVFQSLPQAETDFLVDLLYATEEGLVTTDTIDDRFGLH